MKSHARFASCLFAALGLIATLPVSAVPLPEPPPHAFQAKEIRYRDHPVIVPGSSPATVRRTLGRPSHMLSPDLWVYRHCLPKLPPDRDFNCHTLIIEIQNDHVASMKFVNPRALRVISVCLQAQRKVIYVAAK